MLGRLVTGAATRAAVCTNWYRDAICHTLIPLFASKKTKATKLKSAKKDRKTRGKFS